MLEKKKIFTASDLKIIAFITMIVDHIAYFFYFLFNNNFFYIMRAIGRISMPIYVYLIYQGIKNTSNNIKYRRRIIKCAIITQIFCIMLGKISNVFLPQYNISFYKELNILFSFYISIIIINILEYLSSHKKEKNKFRKFFIMISLCIIMLFYKIVNIEYGLLIPLVIIILYFKEIFDLYIYNCIIESILN